jgi:hypothetical protein
MQENFQLKKKRNSIRDGFVILGGFSMGVFMALVFML